jgi:hypothetical protein
MGATLADQVTHVLNCLPPASPAHHIWLRHGGIVPRVAQYGIESHERLGGWRLVVELTLGRLPRFPKLRIRYEHLGHIHQAFLAIAFPFICWWSVERFFRRSEARLLGTYKSWNNFSLALITTAEATSTCVAKIGIYDRSCSHQTLFNNA